MGRGVVKDIRCIFAVKIGALHNCRKLLYIHSRKIYPNNPMLYSDCGSWHQPGVHQPRFLCVSHPTLCTQDTISRNTLYSACTCLLNMSEHVSDLTLQWKWWHKRYNLSMVLITRWPDILHWYTQQAWRLEMLAHQMWILLYSQNSDNEWFWILVGDLSNSIFKVRLLLLGRV